jgi:hypothetical protein
MHLNRVRRAVCLVFALSLVPHRGLRAVAQLPYARNPATAGRQTESLGAAPRTPDGKPDLSGIWSGAGPSYRFNIAQDLETKDIQPWAEELFIKRVRDSRMDSPLSKCLPVSVPVSQLLQPHADRADAGAHRHALRVSQRAAATIFTDGRDLPKDPNPTWFGYSIGRWDGDTLVITSAGFNDQAGSTAPDTHRRSRSV